MSQPEPGARQPRVEVEDHIEEVMARQEGLAKGYDLGFGKDPKPMQSYASDIRRVLRELTDARAEVTTLRAERDKLIAEAQEKITVVLDERDNLGNQCDRLRAACETAREALRETRERLALALMASGQVEDPRLDGVAVDVRSIPPVNAPFECRSWLVRSCIGPESTLVREGAEMRFAYADPPYPDCAHRYPENKEVDHAELVQRLCSDFPDGWALSTGSNTLKQVLALCPDDVRIGGWFKPFAVFRPNVNPGYAWEPVIFRGGRRMGRDVPTIRDWCETRLFPDFLDWVSCNITTMKGLVGAKPERVCDWIIDFMGTEIGDEWVDLYPGTGVFGRRAERRTRAPQSLIDRKVLCPPADSSTANVSGPNPATGERKSGATE